jgi:hypothetical protein
MNFAALGATAMGKIGLGTTADIGFKPLPISIGIVNLMAKAADGQKPAQRLYLFQGGLQFGDQPVPIRQRHLEVVYGLFLPADVASDGRSADDFAESILYCSPYPPQVK